MLQRKKKKGKKGKALRVPNGKKKGFFNMRHAVRGRFRNRRIYFRCFPAWNAFSPPSLLLFQRKRRRGAMWTDVVRQGEKKETKTPG